MLPDNGPSEDRREGEREHPAAQKFTQWLALLLRDRGIIWMPSAEDFACALALLREGDWDGSQTATLGFIQRRGATARLQVFDILNDWDAYAEIGKEFIVSLRAMRAVDAAAQKRFESRTQAHATFATIKAHENDPNYGFPGFQKWLKAVAPLAEPGEPPKPKLPPEWAMFDDLLQGHLPDPNAPFIGESEEAEEADLEAPVDAPAPPRGLPVLPSQKHWDVLLVMDKESCALSLTQIAETAQTNKARARQILDLLASKKLVESEKRSHVITSAGRDAVDAWRARRG